MVILGKSKKNSITFIMITTIFSLLIIYFLISIYFNKHFFIGTYINGVNVSFKTVEEADTELLNESYNYVLEIKERNDVVEYIEGDKINFEYKGSNKIGELKKKKMDFYGLSFYLPKIYII